MEAFNVENYVRRGKTIVLTLRQDQEEPGRQWGDQDTTLLLVLMEQNIDEFQNQKRRKKDIWTDISRDIYAQNYFWGPEDCRKKWSNMIRTFKSIFENRTDQISPKRIRWSFYEQMLKLFTLPCASFLPESGPIMAILNGVQLDSPDDEGEPLAWKIVSANSIDPDSSSNSSRIPLCVSIPPPSNGEAEEHVQDPNPEQEDVNVELENFMAAQVIEDEYTEEVRDIETTSQSVVGASELETEENQHVLTDLPLDAEQEQVFSLQASILGHPATQTAVPSTSYCKPSSKKRKIKNRSGAGTATEESLTDQFIGIAKEQNERVIALMTKFHEETMVAMRERNSILRDLSDALKQDLSS